MNQRCIKFSIKSHDDNKILGFIKLFKAKFNVPGGGGVIFLHSRI